ncbi:outer membrane protein transport protein [Cytophagaceae bacterium YF14B1]|uniref:Outer membrane protein transport protein n=1 Tax=Xanthocytophaga flava TaxID=3048013 RepID=A0AAE3QMA3_9BACT|nr:outer membrane protein transport protein [Xanthocytophaga flavus]MDJ1481972.1 outer membrane protein transport protein [Xanthocytophaga flavus]
MKKVFMSIFLMASSSFAFAQGFQINLLGTKQTGMAHAGAALKTDASTLVFNPGSSVFLEGNQVYVSGNAAIINNSFLREGASKTEYADNGIAPPFSAGVMFGPKEGKWKAGLAAYTPFGGQTDWGKSWSGQMALTSLELQAIYLQPTFSYKISDKLGIGAGFIINFGHVDLQRNLPVTGSAGGMGSAQLKGNGMGYGFNVGLYYQATDAFSLALTHRSTVKTTVDDGDAIFDVSTALSTSFPQPNTFKSTLNLPSTTTLGLGYKATDKFTLALDINYVHWSVYDTLSFDYKQNTPQLQDTKSPRNYKDSWAFRLGGQYGVTEKLAVRGGVGYVLTPIKDGYVTPEIPDANRIILTLGLGYQITDKFSIDAAFMFEDLEKRTQTNIETGLQGTYKTYAYIPSLALGYKF